MKNNFQRTRESFGNGLCFGLMVFIGIFCILSFGFNLGNVAPWFWIILAGNFIFLGSGLILLYSTLKPSTYYFARMFEYFNYLMAYTAWVFITIPFYWVPTKSTLAFFAWSCQAACFICGAVLGRLRIDVKTQKKNFQAFILITDKGYHLRGKIPEWIVYNRKFKPAIFESLFKFIISVFTIFCLLLAIMGGGAPYAILALIKLTDIQLSPHHIGMIMLSAPSLVGVGYFTAAIWTGQSSWKKTVGHLGTEIWPEDEEDHTNFL